RPPHRLQDESLGQGRDCYHGLEGQDPASDHAGRQQQLPQLVSRKVIRTAVMSPARLSYLIASALVFSAIAGCTSHSDPKVPPPNPQPPIVDLPSPTTAGRTGGAGT